MYNLTIHTSRNRVEEIKSKVESILSKLDKDALKLESFNGEFSSYIYVSLEEIEDAEKIKKHLEKINGVEGVFLKSQGSAPI